MRLLERAIVTKNIEGTDVESGTEVVLLEEIDALGNEAPTGEGVAFAVEVVGVVGETLVLDRSDLADIPTSPDEVA